MSAGFAEFLVTAMVMELTPGPNMVWLALLAAQRGWRAGMLAVAGITLGLSLLAAASITGVAALIQTYPAVYEIIRWAGVLFLLYLAWEAWRGEPPDTQPDETSRHFTRGIVVNLLNPKAAAVFMVLIPSFAGGPAAAFWEILLMTGVYLGIATAAHSLIVVFAGAFQRALGDPKREKITRRCFALLLVAVAIWLAASSSHIA